MRVWGRQVLRGMSARISGALTFSAGRCGTIPVGGVDTTRGLLPPDPCTRLPLDARGMDRAEHLPMNNDGWACRCGFVGSCPNRIRRGGRGAASPPAGVCPGVQEPSRSQREDVERDLMGGADTAPGALTPGPPRANCP